MINIAEIAGVDDSQLKEILKEIEQIIKDSNTEEQAISNLSDQFLISYEEALSIINCKCNDLNSLLGNIFNGK
ncbi:MAG: hypothetical protein WC119_00655 [Synergistaceae bacterium]